MRKTFATLAVTSAVVVLALIAPAASLAMQPHAVAPAPRYIVVSGSVKGTGDSTTWGGWPSQGAGKQTLSVQVSRTWHNSYSVSVSISADVVSAAVGFNVTSSDKTVVSGGAFTVAKGYYGWAGYADVYSDYSYKVEYVQPAYNGNPAKVLGGPWTGTARKFTNSERFYHYSQKYSGSGTPAAPPAYSEN